MEQDANINAQWFTLGHSKVVPIRFGYATAAAAMVLLVHV